MTLYYSDPRTTMTSTSNSTWDIKSVIAVNAETKPPPVIWEGPIGVEGLKTDDNRYLIPGTITERDLPLPFMAQFENEDGHQGSEPAGKITEIWRVPAPDLAPGAVVIWGRGPFDTGPVGQEAARLVEDQVLRGVSLDMSVTATEPLDPDTLKPISTDGVDFLMQGLTGDLVTGISGKIMGCTLVPFPAFEQAEIRIVSPRRQAILAAGHWMIRITTAGLGDMRLLPPALTASAAGLAPLSPPTEWFYQPELDEPTPLTVTKDGRVFGHLATWRQCHMGFPGACELANPSRSGYALFHVGSILTDEGETVPVGRITVGDGQKGGHFWDLNGGAQAAVEHYDRTGSVGAFVRASDGKHGIWLSGAVRSDAPAELIRDLRANPPSGDWRWENGGYELVAALSVPVPGYPVPYAEVGMVASGGVEQVMTIIASGYVPGQEVRPVATRQEQRQLEMLKTAGRGALAAQNKACMACGSTMPMSYAYCPTCGTNQGPDQADMSAETDGFAYTAEQRKTMAKNGQALPDGSFPIANCADAENAIHAQGRAQNQDEAVAHIKKRVAVLGCTGDIFKPYK